VLDRVFRVTHNIIYASGKKYCKPRQHTFFKIMLQLGSNPSLTHAKSNVDQTLDLLAQNCGLEEASDLFSVELASLLEEMKEDFETWDRNTPERFIFDMLVRRSQTAVVDYWEQILEIIAACTAHEKDHELRMDMMTLIEHLLLQENLQSTIVFYSEIIVKLVLIPSTEWRVGLPTVKIRKAAVICLIKIMDLSLIEKPKLYESYKEIVTKMKSCLEDDWANDLRFASIILIKKLLAFLKNEMVGEDYTEIYPEMLKRLDDP